MERLVGHNEDEINRILSREDEILPSSGFAVSVMEAVRREAAAPPPIPFPWKRALPGLVVAVLALVLVLVAGVVVFVESARASATTRYPMSLPSILPPILGSGLGSGLQRNLGSAASWTVLALLLTWVSVKFSMRLASGKV